MKKIGRGALSVLVAIILIVLSSFVCLAGNTAQIEISTYKYDTTNEAYIPSSSFGIGETIVLSISFSDIAECNVRGNSLSVTFDSDYLEFEAKNSICSVKDEKAVFLTNKEDNKANVVWDTTSMNTHFNGIVYYLKFLIKKDILEDKNVKFTINVDELYESSNGFKDIPFNIAEKSVSAEIVTNKIDSSVIALLNKLEKIDTKSLSNITAAMEAYDNLSKGSKEFLMVAYPQQYKWLSTAYERYYAALKKATEDEINNTVADFLKDYKKILDKDIDKVTLRDEATVKKLEKAYGAMPSTCTSRISKDVKAKILALGEKITALKEAQVEAADFKKAYTQYCEKTNNEYKSLYSVYYTLIDEALMVYDSLSDEAKALLKDEYKRLKEIDKLIDELLANDEAEAAIREKINEFQQRWLRVFGLNITNVSAGDRTAIEMVIAEYDKLDDTLKERLQGRIAGLRNLLTVIDSLEEDNESDEESNNQIVQIPGETITQVITQDNIITETVTETETVTKTVPKTTFTKAIWVLLVLLAISFLLLIFPVILQTKYKRLLTEITDFDDGPINEE